MLIAAAFCRDRKTPLYGQFVAFVFSVRCCSSDGCVMSRMIIHLRCDLRSQKVAVGFIMDAAAGLGLQDLRVVAAFFS